MVIMKISLLQGVSKLHPTSCGGFFFVFCLFVCLFVYLATSGLSFSTRDLCCGMRGLLVAAFGNLLVVACGIFSCGTWTLSCGMWDLVPWPGIEPGPPALGVQSLSHWTTREVPHQLFLFPKKCCIGTQHPHPYVSILSVGAFTL